MLPCGGCAASVVLGCLGSAAPAGSATWESQERFLLAVRPTLKLVINLERNQSGSRVGYLEEKIENAKTRRETHYDKCRACKPAGAFV